MGRPPSNGGPSFRFSQSEVAEMEAILQAHNTAMPTKEVLVSLAEKFSKSEDRAGKIEVQMKQVWNWFQNRRYAIRAKASKSPGKLNVTPMTRDDSATINNVPQATQPLSASPATIRPLPQAPQHSTGPPATVRAFPQAPPHLAAFSGRVADNTQMEYEAKSARDGAWYDVSTFLSHRALETGDPEVLVRFAGFGAEEDEWVNVRKNVRQRSLPCESSECVAVLPSDLILCFQEGKEQALYFDAHVLDAQRRRHDVRGCRCRFLVRYDHDNSEEIVALRKICRRPETDYRLQQLHAVNDPLSANQNKNGANSNIHTVSTLRVYPPAEVQPKQPKVEHMAIHSPEVVPQKRQKVDSTVPAPAEVPQRQLKVEPVVLAASGEVTQNQHKPQSGAAPAPSPNAAPNQHKKAEPTLPSQSAQASLQQQKVEPTVTVQPAQPSVEQRNVEPVATDLPAQVPLEPQEAEHMVTDLPAIASLELQKAPMATDLPAEESLEPQIVEPMATDLPAQESHEPQKVEPMATDLPAQESLEPQKEPLGGPASPAQASLEPQKVESKVSTLSAEVPVESQIEQAVEPVPTTELSVEPPKVEATLPSPPAKVTLEAQTTAPNVAATSAKVLQEQLIVEPVPSAEVIIDPHDEVESAPPAISAEKSPEPLAKESPSVKIPVEQQKSQSEASSPEIPVEAHKLEPVVPASSVEGPLEPHKGLLEVDEIKVDGPADGPEGSEAGVGQPRTLDAEKSYDMESYDKQPENVDVEQVVECHQQW